jgi:hypothetical protein
MVRRDEQQSDENRLGNGNRGVIVFLQGVDGEAGAMGCVGLGAFGDGATGGRGFTGIGVVAGAVGGVGFCRVVSGFG